MDGSDSYVDAEGELYHMYLAWQNPDSLGAVTYDGIEVKLFATYTPTTATASDFLVTATLEAAPPSMKFALQDNVTSSKEFDIHPGSAYASGASVEDVSQGGVNNVIVVPKVDGEPDLE